MRRTDAGAPRPASSGTSGRHLTPTSAAWLNQEIWSSILQRQALERDRFADARALGAPIESGIAVDIAAYRADTLPACASRQRRAG